LPLHICRPYSNLLVLTERPLNNVKTAQAQLRIVSHQILTVLFLKLSMCVFNRGFETSTHCRSLYRCGNCHGFQTNFLQSPKARDELSFRFSKIYFCKSSCTAT